MNLKHQLILERATDPEKIMVPLKKLVNRFGLCDKVLLVFATGWLLRFQMGGQA